MGEVAAEPSAEVASEIEARALRLNCRLVPSQAHRKARA